MAKTMIKFLDLKPEGRLADQLNEAYDRVFNSSQYILGKEVEAFESEWAEYCEAKYCVGVGNGHDALTLACKYYARDFSESVETYVPWKTCLPTWAAVENSGLYPYPIRQHQYYVIAVHIYGQITLPYIQNSIIIEDCAQAHGSKLNGIGAGKFGQVACWSMYATKNLGALGDAGAITTDDEEIYEYIKTMRNYGTRDETGINSRLDPLQAAFLRVKLSYLDEWNEQRSENALSYMSYINVHYKIKLPSLNGFKDEPNWHIYAVEVEDRDCLKEYLLQRGIETMIHYPQVPYPSVWHIPEAEEWTKKTLSLPIAPHVSPYVCKQIAMLINEWMEK
jgi:dTDP-4-amino-4,6-dideoxygalactose transaminase